MVTTISIQDILFRRNTSTYYTNNNPLLQLGEPAFETDTYKLKIGNGVDRWNSLPYLTGSNLNDAGTLTTGVLADAIVQESNVTQHEGAITITKSQISDLGVLTGSNTGDQDISGISINATNISSLQSSKQDVLISGTNIKTINGNTLLGSGDITISSSTATTDASELITGVLADGRVQESNVTQHQAALTILTSQLNGTIGTGNIADDNVTSGKVSPAIRASLSLADSASQPGHTHNADDIDDTVTSNKFTTASDISKLAGIEAGADVTDTANVTAAGALMDSEVTNLDQVKNFNSADYATAAQGALADSAVQDLSDLSITASSTEINYTTGVTSSIQTQIDGKANTSHTHSTSDFTATGGTSTSFLRKDNTWATPTNTTYSEISTAEIDAGTASTLRTTSGRRAGYILTKAYDRSNHTGTQAPSTITGLTASASELNILDGATLSTTELNYVDGVTSSIQTQLNGKVNSITSGEPTGSDTVSNIVSLTQAEYDAGTPIAGTFYIIVG